MKNIFTIIFIFSSLYSQSECDGDRYTDEVFSTVNVTSGILYGGDYDNNEGWFCNNQWEVRSAIISGENTVCI